MKTLLDLGEVLAKMTGARKICQACAPYERARFTTEPEGTAAHPRCGDLECGCSCQDAARAS